MDTLSHGLWGGAIFGQRDKTAWWWAFFLGLAPDLLSFGPFFVTRLGDIGERWAHQKFGPPDPSLIPACVYHAYNITHSLIVWSLIFAVLWGVRRRVLVPLGAWGLHILCDIPTHGTHFFPTPFLWPFHTPFYNGTSWGRPGFMLANYALLGLVYFLLGYRKRLPLK